MDEKLQVMLMDGNKMERPRKCCLASGEKWLGNAPQTVGKDHTGLEMQSLIHHSPLEEILRVETVGLSVFGHQIGNDRMRVPEEVAIDLQSGHRVLGIFLEERLREVLLGQGVDFHEFVGYIQGGQSQFDGTNWRTRLQTIQNQFAHLVAVRCFLKLNLHTREIVYLLDSERD